jgi:type I restriction-modification system DNA methylase subunit
MAINIIGITNENEFYTHHYLSAILENDLKDIFKEWKRKEDDEGVPQPFIEIRGLRKEFFDMHSRLEREKNINERLNLQRDFQNKLLAALGYEPQSQMVELDDGGNIPLIGGINKDDGSPDLWIIEAVNIYEEEADPLKANLFAEQYPVDNEIKQILDFSLEDLITRQVYGRTEPPRWVILINSTQMLLLDRTKWNEKRLLRFDIREILDRRETSTLQTMAALLHRDSICQKDGMPLLDTLDENSHKHAFSISEDLKYSLRAAIELLGNEAVWYLQEKVHEKVYGRDMAGQLTLECLRYMYRMLFLFYIEARPELGYLPDKSEEYRKGYSLESLRDLEMVQLTTDESKNGYYLDESIKLLFDLLYDGHPKQGKNINLDISGIGSDHHTFNIVPLRSHLFDPKQTPLLNRVKFRNVVIQEIIELMSLSRPKKGKSQRRGRISYSQLGINQLGAVYEALLSYQGFFAETDLFEVKKAEEDHNILDTAYFVKPEDIEQYTEKERVFNEDGTLAKYEKGTFIYRLAGRDRENSASYYTPEVLTKCLINYALKELLKDKTADEIVQLTVCEPAMGSAAFLNEAVNQLAKAYIDKKQKEIDQTISHEDYPKELQKVKMYIADNNVFGVDLNPVAVELAEVSLWLNTIYEGAFVPWFGMQLVCGNSLIGARRQVFSSTLLKKEKQTDSIWLDKVPERVMPGEDRKSNTIYHFLLPDKGMADYKNKVVKKMSENEMKSISEWRNEFTKPFLKSEIEQLEKLSSAADKLWKRHAEMQQNIDNRTTDPLQIFGQKKPNKTFQLSTTEDKDRIYHQEMFSRNIRNSSPYRRLKLAMDYWCALWFWPIENSSHLPSRAEYLFDLTLLLEGDLYDSSVEGEGQLDLFPDTRPRQQSLKILDEFGFVNVDRLCKENKRFGLVQKLAERHRFLHWELEFADLFESRGGFDLILGNPPWVKVVWNEGAVIGDVEPLFILRNYSASKLAEKRKQVLIQHNLKSAYLTNFEAAEATQNFLSAYQNYPLLMGMKTNLYKCFIPQSWMLAKDSGICGFLHPEGVYDDIKGGSLREAIYPRLKYHFQFENELTLFTGTNDHGRMRFGLHIYINKYSKDINFSQISNLFSPQTIYKCFDHSGQGPIPGIKDDNKWSIKGHKNRIVRCGIDELALFAKLFDSAGSSPLKARLPVLHSTLIVDILKTFSTQGMRLGESQENYFSTDMWNETNAEKDGTICRQTNFPKEASQLINSGPHFFIGNPFYKTPRTKCTQNSHYDVLDLTILPDHYLPRTNYTPYINQPEYLRRIQKVPWDDERLVSQFYRMEHRRRLNTAGERTFICSIAPKDIGHVNSVITTLFEDNQIMIETTGICSSLIWDFWVKVTGKGDFTTGDTNNIPKLNLEKFLSNSLKLRTLILNCLTISYSDLWEECWHSEFLADKWAKNDPRLSNSFFSNLTSAWNRRNALRSDYERRHALIEIDIMTAMALNLTVKELKTIYYMHFPVMKQNEADTWYDQTGRIVFTSAKGLSNIGFPRKSSSSHPVGWEDIKDMKSGMVERTIIDDTMPGGPVERTIIYEAPFDRCDREKDYEIVWAEFERRFKEQERTA